LIIANKNADYFPSKMIRSLSVFIWVTLLSFAQAQDTGSSGEQKPAQNNSQANGLLSGLTSGPNPGQAPTPQLIQTPVAPRVTVPSIQAPLAPVPPQVFSGSPSNKGPTMAEQIVAPPSPIVVQSQPVVVPAGVVYIAPSYAAPGAGWVWAYNPRYGWGWHHNERGWHRGW